MSFGSQQRFVLISVLLLVTVVALVHGPRLPDTYRLLHWEDIEFQKYTRFAIPTFASCFTAPPLYVGLYRPLTTSCYYYVGLKYFGGRIEPLKNFNLLIFVLNLVLVFLICRLLMNSYWALLPALLFASRQAHYRLTIVTVEFQTLFAVFFSLLTIYFFIKTRSTGHRLPEILSYVTIALAFLSKETSVVTVGVLILYGIFFDRNRNTGKITILRPYAMHIFLPIVWTAILLLAFDEWGAQETPFRYIGGFRELLRNYVGHASDFLNFMLPPMEPLTEKFGPRIMSVANSSVLQLLLMAIIVVVVVFAALHRRIKKEYAQHLRLIAFGFLMFLVTLAPYAILKDRLFLRYSYVGHIGIALVLGAAFQWIVTIIRSRMRVRARPTT